MSEFKLAVRAPKVRPLQGRVRVPALSQKDGVPREPRHAHSQAARAARGRDLRGKTKKYPRS